MLEVFLGASVSVIVDRHDYREEGDYSSAAVGDVGHQRGSLVLFIYAAKGYEKLSNMNQLGEEDIFHIVEIFNTFTDSDKYSRVVEMDEIKENDYNLSVTRYVDIFDPPEPVNIQQVWNQLKDLERQKKKTDQKLLNYMKELEIE